MSRRRTALIVDVAAGADIALHHALHRQLGVLAPLPAARPLALSNTSSTLARCDGLALAATVEDDVVHRFAAQRGRLLSPSTQRTASITLDLPQPLGPTMPTS